MTVTANPPPSTDSVEPAPKLVTLTIDGFEVSVPEHTLLIRAAELLGIQIPRFCDHPLLDPVGACRQCLVEVVDAGNGRGMPKPQASCSATDGTETRSNGRARNRYAAEVSAPTGQIWMVLPEK